MKKDYTKSQLFNLFLFGKKKYRLLEILIRHVEKEHGLLKVFTPNPEQIMLAQNDKKFAKVLGCADILVPDGVGIKIASRVMSITNGSTSIAERITGIDLAEDVLDHFADSDTRVLIVGGRDYHGRQLGSWHVRQYSKEAVKKYNHERVLWWVKGFEDVSHQTKKEQDAVKKVVSQLKPAVVFVALGAPNQEFWVDTSQNELSKAGVKLALVVGGAFDVLLGKLHRAPGWMRSVGLEWLYRLYQEPSRWRRQVSLLHFIKLVVQEILEVRSKK